MSGSSRVHRGSRGESSPTTPLLGTFVTMKVLAGEIRQAIDYVNRGVGVRLSGLPLSGRSELLRAIGETLKEQGQPVVQINGNPALGTAPFGALVAAGLAKEPHPRLLGEVTAELDRRFATESPVVLCDDPAELDDWTVGALHSVLNSRRIPLVTTTSTQREQVQSHPFFSLGPAVDIRLAPIHLDQLQLMAGAVLGGPLGSVSLLKVARASGGLFGLALSICTLCQASGRTRADSTGLYRITGELWSPELASLAVKLTVGASDELLRSAARLAQRGPLTLSEAEALIGPDQFGELYDTGIVQRAEQDGTAITWVSAGLLADFLRHEFADSPSRAQPWESAGGHQTITREAGLIGERILHEARQRAQDARQVWQDAPIPEHALPLLIALQQAEAPVEQLRDVIERTTHHGPGAALTLFLQWAIEWLCSHDAETAARRLAETRGPVGPALHEALDILIRSLRMEPLPELPLPRLSDEDGFGQELLCDAEIRVALLRGKNETAARMLSRWRPTLPSVQLSVQALTLLNAAFGTDVAGTAEQASRMLRSIPRNLDTNPVVEILGYIAVLGLYQAGRMHEAWAIAQDLVSVHPRSSDTFRNGIISLGAMIARLEGQELLAMAWATQEDATAISIGPLPGMVGGLLRTALDPTLDPEDCAAGFWHVAAGLIQRGYVANGLVTACWALDRGKGPADVVKQIESLEVESPLLKVIIRHIVASQLADTDGLAACVKDFSALGAAMLATRAELVLALTLRRLGDLPAAAAAASAAWQRAVETGHDSHVLFSPLVRSLGLTVREREIVQLLSQRMIYTEIAETLGLGAGTVDTHLVNIAHKVGAPTRAHLVEAAATWLRLGEPEPASS